MRRAYVGAAIAFLAVAAVLAWPATPAMADPPGFNGTVKIHDGNSEAEPIRRNEPHVGCNFHIHGFNFDGSSSGTWNIQSWPPTGDRSVVLSGDWGPADSTGEWRTGLLSLSDGHYKLNWDQTSPQAPGAEKHKVFWVECQAAAGESPAPAQQSPAPTPTPTPTQLGVEFQPGMVSQPSEVVPPGAAAQPGVAAQPGAVAGQEQAAQQPAQLAGVEQLPTTSTAQAPMAISGLVLLGFGLYLLRRRDN